MASLTQAFETYEKPGLVVTYKLSAAKIYKGSLVGVNSSGYLAKMDHGTASLKFVGVANETIDNSSGAAGDKSTNVTKSGSFVLKAASGYSPAIGDLGKEVYVSSDWEVQISLARPHECVQGRHHRWHREHLDRRRRRARSHRQLFALGKRREDKRQKTKDKRQKTKDKRQKTKDKRQKTKAGL